MEAELFCFKYSLDDLVVMECFPWLVMEPLADDGPRYIHNSSLLPKCPSRAPGFERSMSIGKIRARQFGLTALY